MNFTTRCGVGDALDGRDFIALYRLSDLADRTVADVGETCERVPASRHGGTVSDALRRLLEAGKIARRPAAPVIDLPAPPAPESEN
jgi:hypothetical protein